MVQKMTYIIYCKYIIMEKNKEQIMLGITSDTEVTEMISVNVICRLCANQSDKLIGIYSEDGINNDLATKMNMYLPIKVNESDDLPLQCCWQCASTVLAWHDLVVTSVEAERRLRSYQFVAPKQLENVHVNFETKQNENQPEGTSLNAFCQTENNEEMLPDKSDSTSYSDNLSEFVHMEPRYLTLNNDIYDMKIETKSDKLKLVDVPPKLELGKIFEDEDDMYDIKEESDEMCYGCQTCQMVFLNQDQMVKHIADVHPKEGIKAESDNDKKNSKKEKRKNNKIDQELVTSAKIVVDGKVYYNCKECGRCLYSPYTYVWHMRIHTGERPHKCTQCGKQFRVSQGLVRHLKETHQGIKNFACDICGRMFATRRNVEEHRRIHTNERPYVCDLCGKAFKQKASLFVHNRSHNDSFPFKCSYCNQAFRTKAPLLIHITKHTGEKPYPCEICGRHFRIKYELKRHRLIHSDEKPFSCELCGLSFKQKRYLRNHNKLNHNTLTST